MSEKQHPKFRRRRRERNPIPKGRRWTHRAGPCGMPYRRCSELLHVGLAVEESL